LLVIRRAGRRLLFSLALIFPVAATPAGFSLSGVFGDRAAVSFPDGSVRTLKKGGRAVKGVRLLSVEEASATLEVDGRPLTLMLREKGASVGPLEGADGAQEIVVHPDSRGHLMVAGAINDQPVNFLVDTGASMVAISAADAARAGIDYRRVGRRGFSNTANGRVPTWGVSLASLRIGDMVLYNVEGAVIESGLTTPPLLGMSALKQFEMRAEGNYYVLRKRY